MKKNNIYSLMIMMVMMILVSSCTAESELDKELEESARYYVKYEVNSSWGGYGVTATQTIKFITEKGADSHSQNVKSSTSMKWEGTYGPFKKGDNVSLSVTNTVMNIHGRIYISREKEPFVIKAEDNGSKKLDLKATIDF
jgi:hypothetical protein